MDGRVSLEPTSKGTICERVAEYLLDHYKIAVVPGTGFGPASKDFVRLSFAGPVDKLDEALKRLRNG